MQRKSLRKHVPSQRLLEAQDSGLAPSRSKKRALEDDDSPPASKRRHTRTPEDDEDEDTLEIEGHSSPDIQEVVEEGGGEGSDNAITIQSEVSSHQLFTFQKNLIGAYTDRGRTHEP